MRCKLPRLKVTGVLWSRLSFSVFNSEGLAPPQHWEDVGAIVMAVPCDDVGREGQSLVVMGVKRDSGRAVGSVYRR